MFSAVNTRTLSLAVLTVVSALALGCSSTTGPEDRDIEPIVSSFEDGVEGWSGVGDFTDLQTSRRAPYRGNYLYARDRRQGDTWYFRASDKFTGDLSDYWGGSLEYAIKVGFPVDDSDAGEFFDAADIIVKGGGFTLAYHYSRVSYPRGDDYHEMSVPIGPSQSWRLTSGSVPTDEQLEQVFADVDGIHIRGEYFIGDDWARIDEVTISPR